MAIVRHSRPKTKKRKVITSEVQFQSENLTNDGRLFGYVFDKGGILTEIRLKVNEILGELKLSIRIELKFKSQSFHVIFELVEGNNKFSINQFVKKDYEMTIVVYGVDEEELQNITGFQGVMEVKT